MANYFYVLKEEVNNAIDIIKENKFYSHSHKEIRKEMQRIKGLNLLAKDDYVYLVMPTIDTLIQVYQQHLEYIEKRIDRKGIIDYELVKEYEKFTKEIVFFKDVYVQLNTLGVDEFIAHFSKELSTNNSFRIGYSSICVSNIVQVIKVYRKSEFVQPSKKWIQQL